MAKEKAPAIIFIDELDAIGTKRFDSEKAGDREVQRTMLELLNQLDGFSSTAEIKVGNIKFLMPCHSTGHKYLELVQIFGTTKKPGADRFAREDFLVGFIGSFWHRIKKINKKNLRIQIRIST